MLGAASSYRHKVCNICKVESLSVVLDKRALLMRSMHEIHVFELWIETISV